VTQDLNVSPVYDARFWNPPSNERYRFKNPRPVEEMYKLAKEGGVKIYEAHGQFRFVSDPSTDGDTKR
jgi:1,4-alpha-glucan branching enzyme